MTLEEKIAMAQTIRSRDRFGPVSPEELAALPGTETEIHIPVEGGRTVHVYEERPMGCRPKQPSCSISTAAVLSRAARIVTAVIAAPSWSG